METHVLSYTFNKLLLLNFNFMFRNNDKMMILYRIYYIDLYIELKTFFSPMCVLYFIIKSKNNKMFSGYYLIYVQ